jgi:16S rRNA (cytidine1402-2'-O)-methyltransferase
MTAGRLFVVATPIGNLGDMSPRAIDVLRTVELIAAEDTRHSRRLLTHFNIKTAVTSYHDHNEHVKTESLVAELAAGKSMALITDAGTPGVSDPGYRLVRAAQDAGVPVIAIPGPSAFLAALAVSGLPTDRFTFHGFFPRKRRAAEATMADIARTGGTHVFFEAANRLVDTLSVIAECASAESEACVARELTKVHEENLRGTPEDLARHYETNPPRGECVIVLHIPVRQSADEMPSREEICEMVESLMESGNLSRRDAVRTLSTELGLPRNAVYAAARELK